MFGGLDPKKMQAVMKQMGIKQETIEANRVIIEKSDGSQTIIENPSVVKIVMQGQESWQVSGEAREETGISESDIQLVMEKSGKSYEEAKSALETAEGDIAQAILTFSH